MKTVSSGKSDAEALLGISEPEIVFIYRVYFDLIVNMDGSEEPVRINDSLDVAAGIDAREAQIKVEQHVINSRKYDAEIKEFYITGCKLLASTEI